jgi:glycosyltransferase involved in cell wall biosynthesis
MWMRWFHNAAERIMVSTESLRSELADQGFKNLVIMSRGVDTELFVPREHKDLLDGERPAFLYLGRVAIEKNIEAFLSLDLPGSKHVIGDGPALDSLRKAHPDVSFHGYMSGSDLAGHLASADVMVFPSLTDTFGLVILEALACGVPVAAYPVQGPVDIIENGRSGFVDENLRSAAAGAMYLSPDSCRARALEFSWDKAGQQFFDNLVPVRARGSEAAFQSSTSD